MRRAQPRPEDPTGPQHNFWISVNDLMSSIIFMFLVILGVFSFQMKYEQTSFDEVKQKLRSPTLTRHHILKDLEGLLKEQGLSVEVLESEGILRLSENALSFPAAKALPNEDFFPMFKSKFSLSSFFSFLGFLLIYYSYFY